MRSLLAIFAGLIVFGAVSQSTNYKLQDYGVNSGGTNDSSSATYKAQAAAGELSGNKTAGSTFNVKSGSIEVEQSDVPPAPTLDNGSGTYYNKLRFIINTGNNPTDATFSVAVSTSASFASTSYIQTDGTLGSSPIYQTYTDWGGSSGSLAVSLSAGTNYYFKVNAQDGSFTTSPYGPSASIATATTSLSFAVSPNSIDLGNLNAGQIVTSPSISFSFTTNAEGGGNIYVAGDTAGLTNSSHTITVTPPSADLASLSEGYGLQATSASSPLTIQSPYSLSGNSIGAVYTSFVPIFSSTSSVDNATASAQIMAKAAATTPVGTDYQNILTFVAAAAY